MQYSMNYAKGPAPGGHGAGAKPSKAPAGVAQGHFDPDELTRRLYLVLAEQKAQAERRRKARSERRDGREHPPPAAARDREALQKKQAEPSADPVAEEPKGTEAAEDRPVAGSAAPPGAYHHVPKEAARQFARTTTVGSMRDRSLSDEPSPFVTHARRCSGRRRRECHNNRDGHHPAAAAAAAATATARSGPRMLLLSPLLRKADSLWTLKGRRRGSKDYSSSGTGGAATAGGLEDARSAAQSPTTPTTPTAGKGGAKGFFGRFRALASK
ncbi:hypothetical protein VTH06DRAFT_1633 [Thermothelomyces fergusii]